MRNNGLRQHMDTSHKTVKSHDSYLHVHVCTHVLYISIVTYSNKIQGVSLQRLSSLRGGGDHCKKLLLYTENLFRPLLSRPKSRAVAIQVQPEFLAITVTIMKNNYF